MKYLLLSVLCPPFTALAAAVPPLPASEFADTEVSTNIPVVVNFDRMNRLDFTLSLVPSPSNCVEVAVGTDIDRDGVLSPDEAAYVFGCDCGCWFLRDAVREEVEMEGGGVDEGGGGGGEWTGYTSRVVRTFVLTKRKLDGNWNLVKVTRRGSEEANEIAEIRERSIGLMLMLR